MYSKMVALQSVCKALSTSIHRVCRAQGNQTRLQVQPSRVVVVSSFAHKLLQRGPLDLEDLHYHCRRYSPYAAYSQSKTANILFAKHLAVK